MTASASVSGVGVANNWLTSAATLAAIVMASLVGYTPSFPMVYHKPPPTFSLARVGYTPSFPAVCHWTNGADSLDTSRHSRRSAAAPREFFSTLILSKGQLGREATSCHLVFSAGGDSGAGCSGGGVVNKTIR